MSALLWWLIPLGATLVALGWAALRSRPAKVVDAHSSVGEMERFRHAMGKPMPEDDRPRSSSRSSTQRKPPPPKRKSAAKTKPKPARTSAPKSASKSSRASQSSGRSRPAPRREELYDDRVYDVRDDRVYDDRVYDDRVYDDRAEDGFTGLVRKGSAQYEELWQESPEEDARWQNFAETSSTTQPRIARSRSTTSRSRNSSSARSSSSRESGTRETAQRSASLQTSSQARRPA